LCGKALWLAGPLKHCAQYRGFFFAANEEDDRGCTVENGRGQSDSVGVELLYALGNGEAQGFAESNAFGKERCGVTIGSHPKQDQIEAR